eukprot:scaffold2636_cov340-Pavlova_lutheri.AAC.39
MQDTAPSFSTNWWAGFDRASKITTTPTRDESTAPLVSKRRHYPCSSLVPTRCTSHEQLFEVPSHIFVAGGYAT